MITSLRSFLTRVGSGRRTGPIHALTRLDPARPTYAIGDLHGSLPLLDNIVSGIERDARAFDLPPQMVFLGDMVDRGNDSAGVIERMISLTAEENVTALMGNHERMMLRFLDEPKSNLKWLSWGGYETLLSYGLALSEQEAARLPTRRLMQQLDACIPEQHVNWLKSLHFGHVLELDGTDTILAHAGFSPDQPYDSQPEDPLLWGGGDAFLPNQRLIRGHVIVETPDLTSQCISIDTGAWKTGKLTALCMMSGQPLRLIEAHRHNKTPREQRPVYHAN